MSTPPESDAPRIQSPLPDRRRRAGTPALVLVAALVVVALLIVLL